MMTMKIKMTGLISHEDLRRVLHYCPETGSWTWVARVSQETKPGMRAGHLHPNGYVVIRVQNRGYQSNRLAWFYMMGQWPNGEIDHIDNCKNNDSWVNLRVASRSPNMANC